MGLTWADLDRAAYLHTPDGRLHEGFHAFRRIALDIPALVPLAPFFWLPGVGLIGVPLYRWVARSRKRISCNLADSLVSEASHGGEIRSP
jgi:hypothetical protein